MYEDCVLVYADSLFIFGIYSRQLRQYVRAQQYPPVVLVMKTDVITTCIITVTSSSAFPDTESYVP